jgi:hypothetical protein
MRNLILICFICLLSQAGTAQNVVRKDSLQLWKDRRNVVSRQLDTLRANADKADIMIRDMSKVTEESEAELEKAVNRGKFSHSRSDSLAIDSLQAKIALTKELRNDTQFWFDKLLVGLDSIVGQKFALDRKIKDAESKRR